MSAKKPRELQTGHWTKQQLQEKELAEKNRENLATDYLDVIPEWLVNNVAKNEFIRLRSELAKTSMISNLDYNNLGAYCNAFAKWQNISKRLKLNVIFGRQVNPLVQLELKYSDEMKKYAVMLGLTYEGKLKSLQVKAEQQQTSIETEFGEI